MANPSQPRREKTMTQLLERTEQATPTTEAPSQPTTTQSWGRAALVAGAVAVAGAAVAIAVTVATNDDPQPAPAQASNASEVIQNEIDAALAARQAEPSSVAIVQGEIDRAVAEASLDSGPSSAEVVANQIASALASQRAAALDSGPSSVEIVAKEIESALSLTPAQIEQHRGEAMTEYYENRFSSEVAEATVGGTTVGFGLTPEQVASISGPGELTPQQIAEIRGAAMTEYYENRYSGAGSNPNEQWGQSGELTSEYWSANG